MAYDPTTSSVLLFGGLGPCGTHGGGCNDMWSWDGSAWSQLHPSSPPQARGRAGMAYDADLGTVVLFGGLGFQPDGSSVDVNDTWGWDGSGWTQLSSGLPARPIPDWAGLGVQPDDLPGGFLVTSYNPGRSPLDYTRASYARTLALLSALSGDAARAVQDAQPTCRWCDLGALQAEGTPASQQIIFASPGSISSGPPQSRQGTISVFSSAALTDWPGHRRRFHL